MKTSILHRSRLVSSALVGLLLLSSSLGVLQYSIRHVAMGNAAFVTMPPRYVGLSIDPRIIRRLLGVRILVADLVWIDAMIKSDTDKEKSGVSDFYRAFKTIVTLDPENLNAYWVGGLYLSVIKDDIKAATALLREGVRKLESEPSLADSWKGAWQLPFTLGYNLIFEEQEFEDGSIWIRKAAEFDEAPAYVKDLAKRVSTEQGILEVASRVLTGMYRQVNSTTEKEKIERKLLSVAVRQELVELNAAFRKFLDTTEAYALPKKRAFSLFMRTIGHPQKDMRGRKLSIDEAGIIKVADE